MLTTLLQWREWLSFIHVTGVIFSFAVIFLADKQALGWLRGQKQTLDRWWLHFYHRLTWLGLATIILSGLSLLLPRASYLLNQPLFVMKMCFVGVLFVNAILIGRLMETAATRPFSSLSRQEIAPLFLSGTFSVIGWLGALLIAITIF